MDRERKAQVRFAAGLVAFLFVGLNIYPAGFVALWLFAVYTGLIVVLAKER